MEALALLDALVEALRAEFDGVPVTLYLAPPTSYTAPAVVVQPGDPFLDNGTVGRIEERWDIAVLTNPAQPDKGVRQMREHSLRIRRAVSSVGAVWEGAGTPQALDTEQKTAVFNRVRFKYDPDSIFDSDESSSSSS